MRRSRTQALEFHQLDRRRSPANAIRIPTSAPSPCRSGTGRLRGRAPQARAAIVAPSRRDLLHMVREYPREPVLAAVSEAPHYGLYDLNRLEQMILRRIPHEYFRPDECKGTPNDE